MKKIFTEYDNSLLKRIHSSWYYPVYAALNKMDPIYLKNILHAKDYIPDKEKIFNAFSIPLSNIRYILFGESPYPRRDSANGYAFWDQKVKTLWSDLGLSPVVNRATSLRNFIKMLLVADELLTPNNTTPHAICMVNKGSLIHSNQELFNNLLRKGFLLLNTSLIYEENQKKSKLSYHLQQWKPFMKTIVQFLLEKQQNIQFLLFGRFANQMSSWIPNTQRICAEHPYNLSFIYNTQVIEFFKPLKLLHK